MFGNSEDIFSHDMAYIISLVPCLRINVIFCFDVHKQNKTINREKMGRAVPLKWAEESQIEKWAESSGPRSPGPKWFWAEGHTCDISLFRRELPIFCHFF